MNRFKLSNAGIDVNDGIKRFNGKKEMYEKFLYGFKDDEHYQQMLDAIDAQDVEAAFQASHALKGVAGNLSLKNLHEAIEPLVEEFRKGNLDKTDQYIDAIKTNYEIVIKALEE